MKQHILNSLKLILIIVFVGYMGFVDGIISYIEQINVHRNISDFKNDLFYYPKAKMYQIETYDQLHNHQVSNMMKKKIYIYNTHQDEQYADHKTVMDASYYLKKCLEQYDYQVIIEEHNFSQYLKDHNLTYNDSYKASQYYMNEAIKKYGEFDLCIDLHRDSIPRDLSYQKIDGKSYAKLMFVVAGSSKNYQKVLALSNQYHDYINQVKLGIMRNVMVRKEAYYNQFVQPNVILIECGSNYNTFEEVKNSLTYFAMAIHEGWE